METAWVGKSQGGQIGAKNVKDEGLSIVIVQSGSSRDIFRLNIPYFVHWGGVLSGHTSILGIRDAQWDSRKTAGQHKLPPVQEEGMTRHSKPSGHPHKLQLR
ncbi:hypothetical protein Tco_0354791 [Tanacetum coccineum]